MELNVSTFYSSYLFLIGLTKRPPKDDLEAPNQHWIHPRDHYGWARFSDAEETEAVGHHQDIAK